MASRLGVQHDFGLFWSKNWLHIYWGSFYFFFLLLALEKNSYYHYENNLINETSDFRSEKQKKKTTNYNLFTIKKFTAGCCWLFIPYSTPILNYNLVPEKH